MRALLAGVTGLLLLLAPTPMSAWGLDVHRWITSRAIEGLPPELKPFYMSRAAFINEHAVDPDLWRTVNLKSDRGEEDPNHFLDMDGLDEKRPFTGIPRTWDAYVARYGAERANRMGRLPWRTAEMYQLLVARFRDAAKPQPGYAPDNAAYLSAVLAHYIQDAHVPFHAVTAYDGQATNQRGIHSRFETELVMRYKSTFKPAPVTIKPVGDIIEFVFARLVESEALV